MVVVGGHLILLMSKLGVRVSSGLQRDLGKAFLSLKGVNTIPVLPSSPEKLSSDVNILRELEALLGGGWLQIIHLHHTGPRLHPALLRVQMGHVHDNKPQG